MMHKKQKKYDSNTLQRLCCQLVARYDLVDRLQKFISLLSMANVQYLVSILDAFQFAKLHHFYAEGSKEEKLFISRYKSMCKKRKWYDDWVALEYGTELRYLCEEYWSRRMRDALNLNEFDQESLVKQLAQVDRHIRVLKFHPGAPIANFMYPLYRIVRLSFKRSNDAAIRIGFRFAKKCTSLREMKFSNMECTEYFLESLENLLRHKATKNKSLYLKFVKFQSATLYATNWFAHLQGAIKAISGLKVENSTFFQMGHRWTLEYAKVENIKHLVICNGKRTNVCLFDFARYSPIATTHFIRRLWLAKIQIVPNDFLALGRRRFSRLKHFTISDVNIGNMGAQALAKHSTFWPFIKTFELISCGVKFHGFSSLFLEMTRNYGCENLVILDISCNPAPRSTFNLIANFLKSPNLKQLRILRMNNLLPHYTPVPDLFILGIRSLYLMELDMYGNIIDEPMINRIYSALFSNRTTQLKKLSVGHYSWDAKALQRLQRLVSANSFSANSFSASTDALPFVSPAPLPQKKRIKAEESCIQA